MPLRVIQYPDGQTQQKEIHTRFNYVTAIQIGNTWYVLHSHINKENALNAFSKINKLLSYKSDTVEHSPCKIIKLV